ncbi:MAG: YdcF family protein [Defluviitaleaceae bacterium]|nr:YdcF family protein [Defluviitaleaceae bacterium]
MTKTLRTTLLTLGILSLANATLLLTVSNFTVGFAAQAVISVLMLAYAVFFNKIPKKIHIAIGILCLIPVAFVVFLFSYGNTSNVDYNEDVVIVLGAGIIGETVTRPLAHRLNTAYEYHLENPNAYIIVCGGLGNRARITEAEAMARYLRAKGVPSDKILLEGDSTSTYENLFFAKRILDEHFLDVKRGNAPVSEYRAVVVTNDFHLYRAVRTAKSIGITPSRLGAYTDWYTIPVNYLREMLAVSYWWVFD